MQEQTYTVSQLIQKFNTPGLFVYQMIAQGKLVAPKKGSARVITQTALNNFLSVYTFKRKGDKKDGRNKYFK